MVKTMKKRWIAIGMVSFMLAIGVMIEATEVQADICKVEGCTQTEKHEHNICGVENCTQIEKHEHNTNYTQTEKHHQKQNDKAGHGSRGHH